ncbi:MAG: phosphatidate cytidylyltransferase [Gammaproteobacteria bacterium]|nr:phosphatidate cytidylyltransferase [Gammaproteobacteria bacterium]
MLLQRVATALVLVPLVVAGVLHLSTTALALILALVVLMGGWEWTRLAGIDSIPGKISYLLVLAAVMVGLAVIPHFFAQWVPIAALLFTLFWLFVTVKLVRYHPSIEPAFGKLGKSIIGFLVLAPAWISLWILHGLYEDGPYLLLYLMILIWVADTFAYFSGRHWGRVKLAPDISPGKTREGVYGALTGAALCGALLYGLRPETAPLPVLIIFSVLIALISVVGDLFESLLKRQVGVKDSGNILPGHGGILDRIDSLTAAAPVFLFGLLLLEILR